MSLIADAVAVLTPAPTDEDRNAARAKARDAATPGDWLAMILDHHVLLEGAFAKTKSAPDASSRTAAMKELGIILTGHAIAEENAIYPGMATATSKGDADHAYTEQATVKMEMAKLEKLDPMSEEFLAQLEEIRVAVAHHMIEEEGDWYPELAGTAPAADQQLMTKNYTDAYTRFVGSEAFA
jgi:hypothetical protein